MTNQANTTQEAELKNLIRDLRNEGKQIHQVETWIRSGRLQAVITWQLTERTPERTFRYTIDRNGRTMVARVS